MKETNKLLSIKFYLKLDSVMLNKMVLPKQCFLRIKVEHLDAISSRVHTEQRLCHQLSDGTNDVSAQASFVLSGSVTLSTVDPEL